MAKRPQNKCKSCGYTWYPRGKSISSKCPLCQSEDVDITLWEKLKNELFFFIIVFFVISFIRGNSNNSEVTIPKDESFSQQSESTAQSTDDKTASELNEANNRINVVWNGTTKAIRKALLPEQRKWLKKREKDCSAQDDKIHCMTEMTDLRTEELKQKIEAMSEVEKPTPSPEPATDVTDTIM